MSPPWWIALVALIPLAGCHVYAPTGMGEVTPGETVRLRLTSTGEERLPATIQPGADRFLEGEIVERDGSEVTLAVVATARQRGFFTEQLRERVRLEIGEALEVERRVLDRPRTVVLLVAAGAVVTTAVIQVFTGKTGGNTIDRTDPGPSAARILLLRLGLW